MPRPPAEKATDALHNLPKPATPLVGRTREVAELRQLVLRPEVRLLNLTGPGGTGKTRLALAVASQVTPEFAHGVWFVNLAPLRDPALVVPTIAQTLNIKERSGERLLASLAGQLTDARMLLVLDNFEQVAPAAFDVASLLDASAELKLLLTSRSALHVYGEHLYQVPPLGLPAPSHQADPATLEQYEAVKLFVQRAHAAHAGFRPSHAEMQAIADVCARLDGLPLAIELAAARIRVLPPTALLGRLSRTLALLTSGARNLPERQQTLRNTIDWSFELLDETEQILFRRLSVFAGGCTLDQAEAVCGWPLGIVEGLASLVDKSLLERRDGNDAEPRFAVLETIREYAAERLDGSGEAFAVRESHARVFLDLAERAEPALNGPDQAAWLTRLDVEDENLRAALAWTLEHGPRELGVRLAGALWRFWVTRGYLTEGQQWLDAALAGHLDDVPPVWRAKALNAAGNLARTRGEMATATARHEDSLALRRQLGDQSGVAASLINLGNLAFDAGSYARAVELYAQAQTVYQAVSDTSGTAMALNNLGNVLRELGRLDEAGAAHDESLALRRSLGDRHGVAQAIDNLGRLALDRGDRAQAVALLSESLALARELGDRLSVPLTLEDLAGAAAAGGDSNRAARLWGAAEALRHTLGLPLPPHRRQRYTVAVEAVRGDLGDSQFALAWSAGRALSADEAVRFALGLSAARQETEPSGTASAAALRLLSPREREVAALIAEGMTSREIAERLVISERTADAHADHIRQKLELRSRAEIAVWATRNGLSA